MCVLVLGSEHAHSYPVQSVVECGVGAGRSCPCLLVDFPIRWILFLWILGDCPTFTFKNGCGTIGFTNKRYANYHQLGLFKIKLRLFKKLWVWQHFHKTLEYEFCTKHTSPSPPTPPHQVAGWRQGLKKRGWKIFSKGKVLMPLTSATLSSVVWYLLLKPAAHTFALFTQALVAGKAFWVHFVVCVCALRLSGGLLVLGWESCLSLA